MPLTFDHLNYCSYGCLYCFSYYYKSVNPVYNNYEIALRSANIKKLMRAIDGKAVDKRGGAFYKHYYKQKFVLHWGGMADPFCNFEKKNGIALPLIKFLGDRNYPTLFSFKGDAILGKKYMSMFREYSKQKNFAFQISIVTGNDKLAQQIEMGVPSPSKRLKMMEKLSNMGYYTILRLRPYIIGITNKGIKNLLRRAKDAGMQGVSMEFFTVEARCIEEVKMRYSVIADIIGVKDLLKYYTDLSPAERGGYLRLNRLVKEPYVKTVYKFCLDNDLTFGCSDPDYKELNTSGSCCAMPDIYTPNKQLCNWTKSQLTYALKEARKIYHTTGRMHLLYFNEVYSKDSYLDAVEFTRDHVMVTRWCSSDRNALTQRKMLQRQWNNLKSPACPRNYLHGKVMPVGLDDDNNLIFKYTPSEYEERWKKQGIDLTI